jgi:MoxR-like ATPase
MSKDTPAEVVQSFGRDVKRVKEEIGKMIVGQDDIVDGVLTCLLAGGQALLEGVPGLGKTMLVRTLAESMRLEFSRIQFTPDLMPADILGTTVLSEDAHGKQKLEFRKGPIFSNIVLADEVNRATPKTQSALLEVMQEHSVTIGGKTYPMDQPYFVLATQNPLEMEGTYPLPEAQLDRFLFKLQVEFPSREELHAILDRTTGAETPVVKPVLDKETILQMRKVVRDVAVARHVQDYAIRVLEATHPGRPGAPDSVTRFVRFGGSPARRAGHPAGRQDQGPLRRALQRQHRRRALGREARAAPPHDPELRGRGRGRAHRPGAGRHPQVRARDGEVASTC